MLRFLYRPQIIDFCHIHVGVSIFMEECASSTTTMQTGTRNSEQNIYIYFIGEQNLMNLVNWKL